MKHPSNEDWLSFLYSECSSEQQQTWEHHRQQCPECAKLLENWRESQRLLSHWEVSPKPQSHRPAIKRQLLALAAMAIIGVAFLFGYSFGVRTIDTAPILAKLQQQLQSDIQDALVQYDAKKSTPQSAEFATRIKNLEALVSTQARSTDLAIGRLHQETVDAVDQIHVQLETVALVGEGRYQQSLNQLSLLGQHNATTSMRHTSHPLNHK